MPNFVKDSIIAPLKQQAFSLESFATQLDSTQTANQKRIETYKKEEKELFTTTHLQDAASAYFWIYTGASMLRGLGGLKRYTARELSYFFKPLMPKVAIGGGIAHRLPKFNIIGGIQSTIRTLKSSKFGEIVGNLISKIPAMHPKLKMAMPILKRLAFIGAAYSEFKDTPRIVNWFKTLFRNEQETVVAADQDFNRYRAQNGIEQLETDRKLAIAEELKQIDPTGQKTEALYKKIKSDYVANSDLTTEEKEILGYLAKIQGITGDRDLNAFGPGDSNPTALGQSNRDVIKDRWFKSTSTIPTDSLEYEGRFKELFKQSPHLNFNTNETAYISLTDAKFTQLRDINTQVNKDIKPMEDLASSGKSEEFSAVQSKYGVGDCDNYTLTKMQRLLDAGFPRSALRIGLVDAEGQGHAVLVVTTDRGDLVLDNLSQDVLPWYKTPYTYQAVESQKGSDHYDLIKQ